MSGDDMRPPAGSDNRGEDPGIDEHPDAAAIRFHRLLFRRILLAALVAFVLLSLVRVFALEPYAIPTGSMKPTILEGDIILANKLHYNIRSPRYLPFTSIEIPQIDLPGFGELERGDVVVFTFASQNHDGVEHYVKRAVAIAGDTIRLLDGRIRVNGRELLPVGVGESGPDSGRRAAVRQDAASELIRYGGMVVVPYSGLRIALDSTSAARWRPSIEAEGASVRYRNSIVFVNGIPATSYTFRYDHFFALGDNSADSYDSRYFGFVPYENLVGRAMFIYWSRQPGRGVRWSRIGRKIE